jgi:hypothetical protein
MRRNAVAQPVLKRALVIGCAANVWDEVRRARDLCSFQAVYCVKIAGVHYRGGYFSWVGLHPEWVEKYGAERAALGLHSQYETVAPPDGELGTAGKGAKIDRRVSYRYSGMDCSASSGGYAAKVALDDGFDRIVLAGVPMETGASHFTRGKPWLQRDSFTIGFEKSVPFFAGRVRSMSGWTAEILGRPDDVWLGSVDAREIRGGDDAPEIQARPVKDA